MIENGIRAWYPLLKQRYLNFNSSLGRGAKTTG
jgi:hypothetical protein